MRGAGLAVALAALAALTACTTQEGLPPGADQAPDVIPPSARADFDFNSEMGVATRACVESEIEGPQSLQRLLGKGYTLLKTFPSTIVYARMGSSEGKGLMDPIKVIQVNDPNGPVPCTIRVARRDGTQAFAATQAAMRAQGFHETGTKFGTTVYQGDKGTLRVWGTRSTYDAFATIWIKRDTP